MCLCKIKNEISKEENIYNIQHRVTFYARASTDEKVQLNPLNNKFYIFRIL